jgi:hypothetical protein
MFFTVLTADLPSEEAEGSAPLDDGLSRTHERLTYSPARLLRTLQQVFEQADVRDLAYVVIDGRAIYVDQDESNGHDLDKLLSSVREEGYINADFGSLQLGLVHWDAGIRHVVSVQVRTAVPIGEHELSIEISSNVDDLNVRRLDDGVRYRERIGGFAVDSARFIAWREAIEKFVARIDGALRRTLFRRNVVAGRTNLRVFRPRLEDLLSMQTLPFGPTVRPPAYRVRPPVDDARQVWPDPYLYVWEDPFIVARHWALLDAVMTQGALRYEWVQVAEPDGRLLFEGHKARWFENWPWAQKFVVTPVSDGAFQVVVRGVDGAS